MGLFPGEIASGFAMLAAWETMASAYLVFLIVGGGLLLIASGAAAGVGAFLFDGKFALIAVSLALAMLGVLLWRRQTRHRRHNERRNDTIGGNEGHNMGGLLPQRAQSESTCPSS